MLTLINHTNHPSSTWGNEQKADLEEVIDMPFPNIEPALSTMQVKEIASNNLIKIKEINKDKSYYIGVCLQGEFTYCYILAEMLRKEGITIMIPTTERIVEERNGQKASTFKFVQWRRI